MPITLKGNSIIKYSNETSNVVWIGMLDNEKKNGIEDKCGVTIERIE